MLWWIWQRPEGEGKKNERKKILPFLNISFDWRAIELEYQVHKLSRYTATRMGVRDVFSDIIRNPNHRSFGVKFIDLWGYLILIGHLNKA